MALITSIPNIPPKLPLIIIKDKVLLPTCVLKFHIDGPKIRHIAFTSRTRNFQNESMVAVSNSGDVGSIATAAVIHRVTDFELILAGLTRIRLDKVEITDPFDSAEITLIDSHNKCSELNKDPDIIKLAKEVRESFFNLFENDMLKILQGNLSNVQACILPDFCTNFMNVSVDNKLQLLNTLPAAERLKFLLNLMRSEKQSLARKPRVVITMPSSLNVRNRVNPELKTLEERIKNTKFPENVQKVVNQDFQTLSRISTFNPEYSVIFSYLNLIVELPWDKIAEEILDLRKAQNELEVDHYGLTSVKKRILEYLAVRKLRSNENQKDQGPILCLVGPPGVGKTSIARSIASTLNRPFIKVSLGGVSNVSDIRGHRRTYVGAMPGRIIQALKRSGVRNPVILLDEVDKMTYGVHGNPAAALLEVLDPSQNMEFVDHYINVPFDLSRILFIATANSIKKLSPALHDRLEIINISSYTYLEKIQIAQNYLVPKQLKENGLTFEDIQIPEETIRLLINNYTREAGVRELERKIGALCRAVAVQIGLQENADEKIPQAKIIDVSAAKDILGPIIWESNKWVSRLGRPGIAVGLVVTDAGGNTLAIECSSMPGKGNLVLTGSLGDVIKESSYLAWGWIRANSHLYGIDLVGKRLSNMDVHVHFPEGAVSKDGPSAGITIATSLMSLFLDRPLLSNVAMTGEITLQGLVLPVGGIKEKVIAAHRDGFTKVIIPHQNAKNLHDIPANVKDDLTIVLASDMHAVIETAFDGGVPLVVPVCLKSKI